ncbi:SET domain-containing protein 14-like isoform X1 [Paramacrobiotus metropolitanus]|uniref:SET domain-containing protein 14-like isoform X1 n=1 Tax=Paramacrobiotus metropolitanus TaxID=2943436 RepID=UPI002445B592|nr:SET domain-containing protein 14-like isoform X1 [Paramacrobiotus metropolitanus]
MPVRTIWRKTCHFNVPTELRSRLSNLAALTYRIMDSPTRKLLFKPGDLVAVAQPWIYVSLPKFLDTACYHCLCTPDKELKRCSQCHFARYCSESCQKLDWKPRHKDECPLLQELTRLNGDILKTHCPEFAYWLLIMKVVAKLKKRRQDDLETYHKFHSNPEAAALDPIAQSNFKEWSPGFDYIDPGVKLYLRPALFFDVYSKVKFNAKIIVGTQKDGSCAAEGLALYTPGVPEAVVGCNRNVVYYSRDNKLFVKATRNIYQGDKVVSSIGSPFTTPKQRAATYAKVYAECSCEACTDPSKEAERNAFKCGTVGCANAVPLDGRCRDPCEECGRMNNDRMEEAKYCVASILKKADSFHTVHTMSENDVSKLSLMIQHAAKILHPTNFTLGLLYKLAVKTVLSVNFGIDDTALQWIEKMLLPMELHTDGYLEEIAQNLHHVCLRYAGAGNREMVEKYQPKYRRIVETVYGEDSDEMKILRLNELMTTCNLNAALSR